MNQQTIWFGRLPSWLFLLDLCLLPILFLPLVIPDFLPWVLQLVQYIQQEVCAGVRP